MAYSNIVKFSLSVLIFISFFTNVKFVEAQSSCQGAVNNILKEIKTKGVPNVKFVVSEKIGSQYVGGYSVDPINNPQGNDLLIIAMDSNSDREYHIITDIMASRLLMKNWVTKISKSCKGTGYFRFGEWKTSYLQGFAVNEDGIIFIDYCAESSSEFINPDSPPTWNAMEDLYCAWIPI